MGLGDKTSPDPRKKNPNFEYVTPLFLEMRVCCEYLHCTHSEFLKLHPDERMKLLYYDEMVRRIEDNQAKKIKQKSESRDKLRDGISNRRT